MKLLGHMAACPYVVQHTRLRLCPLQAWLARVYRPRWDSLERLVTLLSKILKSLSWWLQPQMVCVGVPFAKPQPSQSLVTDTSQTGRGAHLDSISTQGIWSQLELSLHINIGS